MENALMTIKDIKFDSTATLSNDQKKALVQIVEEEFKNKRTLFSRGLEEKKHQLLEEYRNKVNFTSLITEIEICKAAVKTAEENLERVGLNENGTVVDRSGSYSDPFEKISQSAKEGYKRLKNLLAACEEDSEGQTKKAKIVAMIWMCRTYQDVMVILREVLGNEIIPNVNKE